jgi:hypothetical protein
MPGRDCCWKFADHSHPAAEVSQSVFWLCAARALMVPAFGLNGDVAEANQDRHDDGRVDGEDSRCDASSLSQIANAPNAAWWLARARHAAAPFASTENREPLPTAELTSMR